MIRRYETGTRSKDRQLLSYLRLLDSLGISKGCHGIYMGASESRSISEPHSWQNFALSDMDAPQLLQYAILLFLQISKML